MLSNDRKLKNIRFSYNDKVQNVSRTINLIEHDIIDVKYYSESGKIVHSYGEIIKIGEHSDTGVKYIIVIDYDYYNDDNIHSIDLNKLYTIINAVHSSTPYSFSPVYCADESVALLRVSDTAFEYTTDGKYWYTVSGGGSGITIDDVDREIEIKTRDVVRKTELEAYSTTEQMNAAIDEATEGLATKEELEGYATNNSVDEKISTATEGLATKEELNNYATNNSVDEKISAVAENMVTKEELGNYSTTQQMNAAIDEATENLVDRSELEAYATNESVDEKISTATENLVTKEELSDYATNESVDEKISTATENLVTKEELEGYATNESVDEKISTATENLVTKEELEAYPTTEAMTEAIASATEDLVDNETLDQAIADVEAKFAGAFHFKGTVETEADLTNIENPENGDVYQVLHAEAGNNAEFAYNGTEWVNLGIIVDLSAYSTTEEIEAAIATAYENAVNEAKAYTDEKISLADIYTTCVSYGYNGTKELFYRSLVELLNNVNVIPTVDDQNSNN